MTMYEKWMNRGTLLKRDPVAERKEGNKSLPAFLTEQQQYNIFQNRAKERDEKDLLQQVVSIVQESTKEVKSTLDAVKFKLDSSTEFSGDKFNATLKSFLEDICKHEDRMLHAVEEQRCILTRVHDLEHELAVKTAELKHLQSQQQTQDREEDAKRLARTVCQELHSPNLTVKNKLEEILEVAHETSKQQCQQLNQYKKQMTNQGKQYVESKNANQRLIKDMEKRLLKEITNFCSTVQQQEQKWQSSLQELLAEAAMSQKQDIKQFLEKLCSSDRKGDSKQRAAADTQVLTQTIRKEIQLLLTKQAKTVEKCVQDLLKHQLYDQGQQLKNLQAALVTDMTLSVEAAARHFSSDLVMPLSLPKFEKKMEEHHADLKHQLEELHHRHLQEVLRIQNELKSQCMATSTLEQLLFVKLPYLCRQAATTHTHHLTKMQ
ncbi:reticulocyte-binding protein 2 homolog a-like isoform X2 [Pomacea canaliculata]|nr:reticulocyte-binding protein 2 homolog a-like isoform X2 [Pomacea canaliculata]